MSRVAAWLAIVALAVVQMLGCGRVREPDLVIWHAYRGGEEDALRAIVDDFNAANEGTWVELVGVPYEAYANKLQAAIPRGNGPDLFIFAHGRVGGWAQDGLIAPIEHPVGIELLARMPESARQSVSSGDRPWAIPLSAKAPALFYNVEHLRALGAEPPTTVSSMLELARRFNDASAGRYGLVYQNADFFFHVAWLHAFSGRIYGEDGQPHLDSPAMASSLELAARLRNDEQLVPRDADYAIVKDRFAGGHALFAIQGPWFIGELGELDFGVVPLPTLEATGQPMRPFVTVEALYVSAQMAAERSALAWQVIDAIAGREGAVTRALVGGQVVVHEGALTDPRIAQMPVLAAFARAAAEGVPTPNVPSMESIWTPASRALESVLRGSMTPREASAQAEVELQRALQPPPPPVSPMPFALAVGALLLVGASWLSWRAVRQGVPRAVAEHRYAYPFVIPAVLSAFVLIVVPFVAGAAISFLAVQGEQVSFVGFQNYWRIISSADYSFMQAGSFYFTLLVTVVWTLLNVGLHVSIGLGLAMLLRDEWVKLRGIYRVLLIIPWAVPNYITALVWKMMFNFQFGAINSMFRAAGLEPVDWFSRFSTAFAANLATNTWLGFPFMMVVSLGALQAVPRDLEDAAELDGATKWQRFRHITLPLLRPALVPAMVLGSVWTFNMFNVIYLVSGGAPGGSTEILITEAYRWAFERHHQYGYAAAYGVLIFGVLLVYTRLTGGLSSRASDG